MKSLVKFIFTTKWRTLFILFSAVYLFYLAIPTPPFPEPPSGALQSAEPADQETTFRRGYFTDLSREEVLTYYENQFASSTIFTLPFLSYRRNYRPEDAYGIIRDQTRSTFLEEIIHPFRESLYINGFEPKQDKDKILIEGKEWKQKITLKWVPSSLIARLGVGVLTLVCIYLIFKAIIRLIYSTFLRGQESTKEGHA